MRWSTHAYCRMLLISLAAMLPTAGHGGSPEACAKCHAAQSAAFAATAMARALEAGGSATILRANPKMAVMLGGYSYQIAREGKQSIYSVSDGRDTFRTPVEWAFGNGVGGQTYVFTRDGNLYESRVSYFAALRGLALTIGHERPPRNLAEAAGRAMPPSEMRLCFACHATNVPKTGPVATAAMVEGVQCERCHGATEEHLASGRRMVKLGALSTEGQLDFCGQCHRTWAKIAAEGPRGIQNIRFQPYRLANSRCYDPADRRIRCTACHDPHGVLETASTAYDAKCTACHGRTGTAGEKAAAGRCKVAAANCVSCHMPRLELPGAHEKFTDHRIRIVKANEAYPD